MLNRTKFVYLLAVFALGVVVTIAVSMVSKSSEYNPYLSDTEKLVPEMFKNAIESIDLIEISKSGRSTTLEKQAGVWVVAEKSDYPAAFAKLKSLMLSLSQGEVIEHKTANEAKLVVLHLSDANKNNPGIRVKAIKDGDVLIDLMVGKTSSAVSGSYIRAHGNVQSYLWSKQLSISVDPLDWIDHEILSLNTNDIQSIEVQDHQSDFSLKRTHSDEEFVIFPPPDEKQNVKKDYRFIGFINAFRSLQLKDVVTEDEAELNNAQLVRTLVLTTFKKESLTLKLFKNSEQQYWITLSSEIMIDKENAEEPTLSGRLSEQNEEANPADNGNASDRIDNWNRLHNNRVYRLAPMTSDELLRKREDIVQGSE